MGKLAGLSSSAATECHKWLAHRWLTFARDVWQAWGKAQPPRPPRSRDRAEPRPPRPRAYTATGLVARPTRARDYLRLPTQAAGPPPRQVSLAFRPGLWLGPAARHPQRRPRRLFPAVQAVRPPRSHPSCGAPQGGGDQERPTKAGSPLDGQTALSVGYVQQRKTPTQPRGALRVATGPSGRLQRNTLPRLLTTRLPPTGHQMVLQLPHAPPPVLLEIAWSPARGAH